MSTGTTWITAGLDVEVLTAAGEWITARTVSGVERPDKLVIVWVEFPDRPPRRRWIKPVGRGPWVKVPTRIPWPVDAVRQAGMAPGPTSCPTTGAESTGHS